MKMNLCYIINVALLNYGEYDIIFSKMLVLDEDENALKKRICIMRPMH